MNTVKGLRYQPTKHAIERAQLRFGIDPDKCARWVNQLMREAKYIASNGANGLVYQADNIRIIVDGVTDAIITVHDELRADFLRPILKREKRKLHRLYTPKIRRKELEYAEALQELANMAVNRAKARNPKTRETIAEKMMDKRADISRIVRTIERLNDDWRTKVRAIEVIAE